MSGSVLLAFVDLKDPFCEAEVANQPQPGPILSIAASRPFAAAELFFTPHASANAAATVQELERVDSRCRVSPVQIPVSDPKDYSSIMGALAREVRRVTRSYPGADFFVCASSGTAEMRTCWFMMQASGMLRATMLQVGSPIDPLSGAANVRPVNLDSGDWDALRDLVMPAQFFARFEREELPASPLLERSAVRAARVSFADAAAAEAEAPASESGLDEALQELGIFVGSAVLREAAERASIAAGTDLQVLLTGETGTGKDLFARLIHRLSERRGRPMVAVNCAAIPKDLVESYLFGHVKGAFTGAVADSTGKFEEANGTTLFLDEVGELPLEAQAKVLRVLQDAEVEKVGASGRSKKVDVRIIAATLRDLRREVAEGRFREDLYYRLEVIHIRLPALRERRSEVPHLAAALLHRINQRRKRPRQLSAEALRRLEGHCWSGNVRELSNVLERSVLYAPGDVLAPEDLIIATTPGADPFTHMPDPQPGFKLDEFLDKVRRHLIQRALDKCRGNQSQAAELLGVTKQAVNRFVNHG